MERRGGGAWRGARNAQLAPLVMPTAVSGVVDRLLTAMALGEFVPGEKLPPERELAQLLGVSRDTVHAALTRLRAEGVLEVRRGRSGGSFVLDSWNDFSADAVGRTLVPHRSELEQLCDLRCRFEETVARTAAERRTDVEAESLLVLLGHFRDASTPEQEHAADIAVHEAVLAATHNPAMVQLSHDLLARVALGMPIEPYDANVFARALDEHSQLVTAVVEMQVEDAGRAAREHFSMSTRTLRAVIGRGSLAGTPAAQPITAP